MNHHFNDPCKLSPREREIVEILDRAPQTTNKELARLFNSSPNTVKNQVRVAREKLKAKAKAARD